LKFLESEKPKTADPAVLRVRNAFCLALGERLLEEDEEVLALRLLEEEDEALAFRLLEEDEESISAAEVDELVTKILVPQCHIYLTSCQVVLMQDSTPLNEIANRPLHLTFLFSMFLLQAAAWFMSQQKQQNKEVF
jgi:hypothetical protein